MATTASSPLQIPNRATSTSSPSARWSIASTRGSFRSARRRPAVHVSGGEFNCAANLADCFRLNTGIATAMVDYPIGDLIAERVQAMGVKPFYKPFKHDGARGPTWRPSTATAAAASRAPVVFYNRCNEAAARLKPGDFDWKAIFGEGVRWFHSGGIFAALADARAEVIIEAMQAAKAAGAVVSFDLNYREKLWNARGGNAKAQSVFKKIIENVDVLVGNEEDLQNGLGVPGPDVAATSKLDPPGLLRHDRPGGQAVPERQGGRDHAARGALDQPPQLERGGLDRRQGLRHADLRARRLRSRRRRRRLRLGPLLRAAHRRVAGGVRQARLGARRAARRRSPATRRWPASSRSAPSPRAARRASSGSTRNGAMMAPALLSLDITPKTPADQRKLAIALQVLAAGSSSGPLHHHRSRVHAGHRAD